MFICFLDGEELKKCIKELSLFDNLEISDLIYCNDSQKTGESLEQLIPKCVKLKFFRFETIDNYLIYDHYFSALSNLKAVEKNGINVSQIES